MSSQSNIARALAAACLLGAFTAQAADPPAGFSVIGHIERFTLEDPVTQTSAATLRVRGLDIRLPANLVITMPGGYLTAQQLFKGRDFKSAPNAQRSGLALVDLQPADLACPNLPEFVGRQCPLPPAEVEVMGNIIGGEYRAGVVRLSQGGLHIGGGFIRDIRADGTLLVGNDTAPGPVGLARVKLNDPEGIYGPRMTGQDMRFALDPGNSPVHARTGFPVCVPRSDSPALCPAGNRPPAAAPHYRRFTCGAGAVDATAPAHAGCQPHLPAPLAVGDFVNYVGRLDKDERGYFVSAHGIDAELGIYTAPGVDPAYVFVEEALEGTLGERFADIPQEETSRFKLVGFTTDPSRTVSVEIFDADADGNPLPPTAAPARLATRLVPTNGAQLGRFKMIWSAKEDARVVRRAVRVTLSAATEPAPPGLIPDKIRPGTASLGLALTGASLRGGYAFGTYEAPISEYITPEATRFGVKGYQPPVNFENFCFLKRLNVLGTQEPDLSNPKLWVTVKASTLVPSPAARPQSQQRNDGTRVCGD